MSYLTTIKTQIGKSRFERLEKEARKELSLSLKMPLKSQYGDKQYYHRRFLSEQLFPDCYFFHEKGLQILPIDVIHALYRCKLLCASKDKDSFLQRSGEGAAAIGMWRCKQDKPEHALEYFFDWIKHSIKERTLLTQLDSFIGPSKGDSGEDYEAVEKFFEQVFQKLNAPFVAFINQDVLMNKYKQLERGLSHYRKEDCQHFFNAPSIGFKVTGSEWYCHWYAASWLRTFLHLLRIAGFIHPGQIQFSNSDVSFVAPKSSVWLASGAIGCYSWDEGLRPPWRKIPDGNLFLSFGYRGLTKMWLDKRTFRNIETFILEYRAILESMKNPWKANVLSDVIPTVDLLNTVTQLPDDGAKLVLLYCCLEHLFVPRNIIHGNKGIIVKKIKALRPDLLKWFDELYKQRCAYAHRGFLATEEWTRKLMVESTINILSLLKAKSASC